MTEKSPWADAIGPLLTLQAFAEETGLSQESIEHFISRKHKEPTTERHSNTL